MKINLASDACAIIISASGDVEMHIPAHDADALVPDYVLAVTELMTLLHETGVHALADAFKARKASDAPEAMQ
jgi:hypothetical protein